MALAVHSQWAALFLEFSDTDSAGPFHLRGPPSLCSTAGSAGTLFPSCELCTLAHPPNPTRDTASPREVPDTLMLDCPSHSAHCLCPKLCFRLRYSPGPPVHDQKHEPGKKFHLGSGSGLWATWPGNWVGGVLAVHGVTKSWTRLSG